ALHQFCRSASLGSGIAGLFRRPRAGRREGAGGHSGRLDRRAAIVAVGHRDCVLLLCKQAEPAYNSRVLFFALTPCFWSFKWPFNVLFPSSSRTLSPRTSLARSPAVSRRPVCVSSLRRWSSCPSARPPVSTP